MTNLSAPTPSPPAPESTALGRAPWHKSLAPQFIGLFLWVVYFDQIPRQALGPGGVIWPVLGAAVGGLFCYLFLYRSPAMWGMSTGRPLIEIAASTFGAKGATWVPGVLLAGAGVVWLAVSTFYATTLILRGLVLIELLDPKYLLPLRVGGAPGVLFLVTSLIWCFSSALVGRYLVRVIAALMNVFTILPAVFLAVTTVLAFRGLRGYHGAEGFPPGSPSGMTAALVTVQMIFGFFATSGLSSADWGNVARDANDVRAGGWVGVFFASWVVATLAILSTAGAVMRDGLPLASHAPVSYVRAVEWLVGGRFAGSMFLILGLAALAPACYSSFVFATRLNDTWPRLSRTHWTLLGAGVAWLILICGLVDRLFDVFSVIGGLVAPAVGAIAADYVGSRGVWPGARAGYNRPGMLAWVVGTVVGLAPYVGSLAGDSWLATIQPAAVFGFLAAFVAYYVAAGMGLGSAPEVGIDPILAASPPD